MTIRGEASRLLHSGGLQGILERHGIVVPTGSYYLDLMAWRDLDLYLIKDDASAEEFFLLGAEINSLLGPVKMSFRNELIGQTEGLPAGLYWGVYFGDEKAGAWKIDIWCVSESEAAARHGYCEDFLAKLDDTTRQRILTIKERCWRTPNYRRGFSSVDIHEAVLDCDISTFEAFRDWLNARHEYRLLD